MINEFRTLLLDYSGATAFASTPPGDEYVDPEFRPHQMSDELRQAWRGLFGANNPDRVTRNAVLRLITDQIYGLGLDSFLTRFDQRQTFWPSDGYDSLLISHAAGPVPVVEAGSPTLTPQFSFESFRSTLPGVAWLRWRLTTVSSTETTVTRFDETDAVVSTTTVTPTVVDSNWSQVTLTDSDVTVRFPPAAGTAWRINWVSALRRSWPQTLSRFESAVSGTARDYLFPSTEPYRSFRNMWSSSDQFGVRLAGVALALGHRIADEREGL